MADRHIPNVLDPYGEGFLSRERRGELAEGLRAFAGWIEASRFPLPTTFMYGIESGLTVYSSWISDEDFVRRPGSAIRLIGGHIKKGTGYSNDFTLTRDFGGGAKFTYSINRDAVCTPRTVAKPEEVQVPVDEVEAAHLEAIAEEARRELEHLERTTVVRSRDVVEYDCPQALLPAEREGAAA